MVGRLERQPAGVGHPAGRRQRDVEIHAHEDPTPLEIELRQGQGRHESAHVLHVTAGCFHIVPGLRFRSTPKTEGAPDGRPLQKASLELRET